MSSEEDDGLLPDGGTTIEVNYSEDESPTYAVVKGLAALKGIADTEVDPLYNQIQTESMNRLLHQAQMSDRYTTSHDILDNELKFLWNLQT